MDDTAIVGFSINPQTGDQVSVSLFIQFPLALSKGNKLTPAQALMMIVAHLGPEPGGKGNFKPFYDFGTLAPLFRVLL